MSTAYARAHGRALAVTLREVTRHNIQAVMSLDAGDGGRQVAPNAKSMAQAAVYGEAWPRAIFAGDQPQVTPDRKWVSFLWSYPNMVPLGAPAVERIVAALHPYPFERIYGAFGRNILTGAKDIVMRSAQRYTMMLRQP